MMDAADPLLRQALRVASLGHYTYDIQGDCWTSSDLLDEIFGIDADYRRDAAGWLALVHPSQRQEMTDYLQQHVIGQGLAFDKEYMIQRVGDGAERWVHGRGLLEFDAAGAPARLFGVIQDVTERKAAERTFKLAASVFTHAHEGICITDAQERIVDVNPTFCEVTGYRREELIGQTPRILKSGRQGPEFYAALWKAVGAKGFWRGEIWNRRKDGEAYPELLTVSAVPGPRGEVENYVGVFTDITRIKLHEEKLEHVAHYDALTDIPNRVLLADRMGQAIAQTRRSGHLMAVCYLDLDGFKPINDSLGHAAGDRLLVEMASRLKQGLRGGDTVARLGGDEFVLLLLDMEEVSEVDQTLSRVLHTLSRPVILEGTEFVLSASIGVALFPDDDVDPDTLLRHADQAMYQAKQLGRARYHLFDPEHDRRAKVVREQLFRIEQALANNELVLHYQPKVNMRLGQVVGAEALVRWQHPERGLLPPLEFLPLIEDHDLIIRLGEWVMDQTLQQMTVWQGLGLDLEVSVNIAARHLQQENFIPVLKTLLARYPAIPTGRLELEVLETAALEDMARVSQVMEECRSFGVGFALDDFGTGYSSLTYFKRLPASVLKIDQSFVRDMLKDAEDRAIVEGVIGLTRVFQRTVIAEGVETVDHGVALLAMGCELAQGYGIARPMPAAELPSWVTSWRPDVAWGAQ
ncbi:MAG: EAL domain-containing protein [Rhodocyclaceae bacterium]|nr:EAL domain-containing protein [Rhodocyclaceae bacterium]